MDTQTQQKLTIGIKGFYSHTPKWAQNLILTVFTLAAAALGIAAKFPDLIPANYQHVILLCTPVIMLVCSAIGIVPTNKDNKEPS